MEGGNTASQITNISQLLCNNLDENTTPRREGQDGSVPLLLNVEEEESKTDGVDSLLLINNTSLLHVSILSVFCRTSSNATSR